MKRISVLSTLIGMLAGPALAAGPAPADVDCSIVSPYGRMESGLATTFQQYFGVHPLDADPALIERVEALLPACTADLSDLRRDNAISAFSKLKGRVAREARVRAAWEEMGRPPPTVMGVALGSSMEDFNVTTAGVTCTSHEFVNGGFQQVCTSADGRTRALFSSTSMEPPRVKAIELSFSTASDPAAVHETVRARLGLVMPPEDYDLPLPEKWETAELRGMMRVYSDSISASVYDRNLENADNAYFEAEAERRRREQLGTGIPNF